MFLTKCNRNQIFGIDIHIYIYIYITEDATSWAGLATILARPEASLKQDLTVSTPKCNGNCRHSFWNQRRGWTLLRTKQRTLCLVTWIIARIAIERALFSFVWLTILKQPGGVAYQILSVTAMHAVPIVRKRPCGAKQNILYIHIAKQLPCGAMHDT